ncbi:hypothetical protein CFP56_028566 [Quercus suber]|uniref:Uncharacterized protein n=1 Tax=Quercus suber TaxID=58331 RepID=A0AAW0JTR5_QUESU
MAFRKSLTWVPTFLVILLLASIPFLQSSRTRFQGGTTMPENTVKLMAQEFQIQAEIFGNGGASVLNIEDSAREVPTGPDPLHHNNNPIEP